ncbi:ion channel [Phytohabitans flavus]|uniref:potassium channel family protein n=1 Tax=Phytohabitans flavus TaxID=1076124 RepID=UPI00156767E4|nr:potassium channel family protein [Phytohabitans flavus]
MDRARPPRFGALLASIVVLYILIIALGRSTVAVPLRVLVLAAALMLAARVAGRRDQSRAALAVALAAIVLSVVAVTAGGDRLATGLTSAATVTLACATIAATAQTVVRRDRVDIQAVAGALATYLLLALVFSNLHQLIAAILGNPYLTNVDRADDASAFLYFSVITLTTVGYGDIVPASNAARAIAVAEAITGQLYLVSVVAAVVARWRPRGQA